jgi:hypothetical protein
MVQLQLLLVVVVAVKHGHGDTTHAQPRHPLLLLLLL